MSGPFRRGVASALLFASLLASAGASSDPDGLTLPDRSRLLRLGDSCYRIPEWNGRLINATPFPPLTERRQSTNSLSLRFSSEEVARQVSGFQPAKAVDGKPLDALIVSVYVQTPQEIAQRRSNEERMHLGLLYAEGGYESRVVERIPGTSLYRLYWGPDRKTWMIVTRAPDMVRRNTQAGGNLWIAACSAHEDPRVRSCETSVDIDQFHLSFNTLEAHVPRREELAKHFAAKLTEWKSRCD